MGVIYNTLLATSQPLSICHGFALFPKGSGPFDPADQRTGIFENLNIVDVDTSPSIIDLVIVGVDFPILLQINLACGIGFCGPALAIGSAATGETFDGGTAVVQFTGGEAQGGWALGAAVGFTLDFHIGLEVWYDVLVADGSFEIFGIGFTLNLNFDILGTVIGAIQKALEEEDPPDPPPAGVSVATSLAPIEPPPPGFWTIDGVDTGLSGQVWGMFDQTQGPSAMDGGQMIIQPTVVVLIDVAPYIPYVKQLKELVETVGGELATGPSFSLGFPITINVLKLITDGDEYEFTQTLSADAGRYQQMLAEAAIEAYNAQSWYIPQLPDLLALAGRTVLLGIYPDTTNYFTDLITGAGGTVPTRPVADDGLVGNALGFTGGPDTAARLINNVKVQFTHEVGMTVGLGWFFSIGILGLTLDANIAIDIDLTAVFGPIGGTKIDQIQNINGGQFVTAMRDDAPCVALEEAQSRIERRFVDVVFEPVVS